METLYKAYKDKAQFFVVYIREAHPAPEKDKAGKDQQKLHARRWGDLGITQPKTLKERAIAADKCMKGLKLTVPILLDPMEGDFLKAYGGYPAGTTVIDIKGKLAHWTRGGPFSCKPALAEAALKKLIAAGGAAVEKTWKPVKLPKLKAQKAEPATTQPEKKETDKANK